MKEEIDLWKRATPFTLKDRFFKWGIYLCNGKYPYYGGHTRWLVKLLDVDYLHIAFDWHKIGISHFYYDGYHHGLYLGIITINWGGRPYVGK